MRTDGTLEPVNVLPLDGGDPRGFALSPDDRYLMIGLCDQSAVQIYELNEKNGIPEKKVCETSVPSPASFVFA